jgi:ribosomal protein S19
MTSDSDDLEEALRENLKLRHELAAKVDKAKDTNKSQRVSRDFHRLGIIIALMVGAVSLVLIAHDAVTVRLWEVTYGDLPVVLVGVVEVAVVCLAVYGLVRAIGWLINNFTPS